MEVNRKGGWEVATLNRTVRVGFTEKVTKQLKEMSELVIQIPREKGYSRQRGKKLVDGPSGMTPASVFKKQQEGQCGLVGIDMRVGHGTG